MNARTNTHNLSLKRYLLRLQSNKKEEFNEKKTAD